MIDIQTGEWHTDDGVAFPPRMGEAAFIQSGQGKAATKLGSNNGWSRYQLATPQLASGRLWGAIIYFYNGKLAQVSLALFSKDAARGWDSWSESDERARDKEHKSILAAVLGPSPYRYAWGQVDASYDPKGGFSAITIRYK